MSDSPQMFRTPFREFRGVYEFHKTQALTKHLRAIAEATANASVVRACSKCEGSSRSWINLQEYVDQFADFDRRSGEWITELELEALQ